MPLLLYIWSFSKSCNIFLEDMSKCNHCSPSHLLSYYFDHCNGFLTGLPVSTLLCYNLPWTLKLEWAWQVRSWHLSTQNPPLASQPYGNTHMYPPSGCLTSFRSLLYLFMEAFLGDTNLKLSTPPPELSRSPQFIFLHSTYYRATNRMFYFCILFMVYAHPSL